MRTVLVFCLILFPIFLSAQSHEKSIRKFQKEMNKSFGNPEKSPLMIDKIQGFEGLPFFTVDEKYLVTAKFERLPQEPLVSLKTSDKQLRDYERYAIATFELEGKQFRLTLFKSTAKVITPGYENSLFLPFTDQTNGKETYGGGRYMDVEIPLGDTIILDFNKAYNPYCAYSDRYSCPIPPRENDLQISILSGVKIEDDSL